MSITKNVKEEIKRIRFECTHRVQLDIIEADLRESFLRQLTDDYMRGRVSLGNYTEMASRVGPRIDLVAR